MIENRTGQQFGKYRLIRFLGQGGFAEVYLGEHIYLKTLAALKVLRVQLANNVRQDFLKEAQIIAQLDHPHIVRLLEYDIEGNIPFLVMNYAPNGALRQHHQKGSRLPVEWVLSYVQQVASALQYAHDQRLVHRDIKPENMLLGRAHEVLLSDFGLALFAQSTGAQTMKEMAGTMSYMAPEQIKGKPQPASDQYALGIVVYEWLSGDCPFQGMPTEIMSQHLVAPLPPLSGRIPGVSPAVERVVFTALAKEPQQRFPTVQAFATSLEQAVLHGSFSSSLMSVPQNGPSQFAGPVQRPNRPSLLDYSPQQSISTSTPPYQSQPPMEVPPAWGNHPGPNVSQQGTPLVPPPPPGFIMQNPGSNINTPSFGRASGQFSPQMPSVPLVQERKKRSKTGLMIAVIVLVVILVAVTSAGATYFFAGKQSSSTGSGAHGSGAQTQLTTTLPQTGISTTAPTTSIVPTATPTPQATAADTTTPTVPTTPTWGPGTKSQVLICIATCNDANNSFDVTLVSINIDTKLSTMAWNFAITDKGNVCTNLSGRVKLVDPTGTEINANGGTFTESSSINSGQTLPKTATFSILPQSGVLYEVQIDAGCYASSTYAPEHFQR